LLTSQNNVLLISSLAHAYSHACIVSIPPILLLIKYEFSLNFTMLSLVVAGSGLLFGIGALPFGALSDKIGPIKVNIMGVVLAILSCIGIYITHDIISFVIFLLLLGLASSTYHPSAFKLISCLFSKNIGRAFGINGLIGSSGQIMAPISSAFIAYKWGWRPVFLMLAIMGIITLIFLFSTYNYNISIPKVAEKQKFRISREIILILAISTLGGLSYRSIVTMLPAYTSIIYGKDTLQAGALVTLMLVTGGISQVVAGEINDKYGSIKPFLIATIISFISIVVIMMKNYSFFMIGLVIFGSSYFAINLFINSLIGTNTPHIHRGKIYGITFFTRFGLGFLAPVIVGIVTDLYSISYLFHIVIIFMTILVLLTMYLYRNSSHVPCRQEDK